MRHYHIVRLQEGQSISQNGNAVQVDLSAVSDHDHITNDEAFLNAQSPGSYFYVSGGGSIVINNRYLLVVKRDDHAPVNPGQLSLFTGRAEGPDEWANPHKVVRELFEELLLYSHDELLYPQCQDVQGIIDAVYVKSGRTRGEHTLPLTPIALSNGTLRVIERKEVIFDMSVCMHINTRRDINLFYLFAAHYDIDSLSARDDESGRQVGAIDMQTRELIDLSPHARRAPQDMSDMPLSENLRAVLQLLIDRKTHD